MSDFTDRKKRRQPIENQLRRTRVIRISEHPPRAHETAITDRPFVYFYRARHYGRGDSTGPRFYRPGKTSLRRLAHACMNLLEPNADWESYTNIWIGRHH